MLNQPVLLMKIEDRVVECTIVERTSRFTVKVVIDNYVEKVHITNTGRLKEFIVKDKTGYCVEINGFKLKYRLIAVSDSGYAALIDTLLQERAFIQAVHENYIPWFKNCYLYRRNYRLNNSVIDFVFKCNDRLVLVEVKSAVLRIDEYYGSYPDCPSIRGRKQIMDLIKYVENNGLAYIVFIVGLPRVYGFKPYSKADPIIAELLKEAYNKGVYLKAVSIYYDPFNKGIVLENPDLEVNL